jgi:hypothetical protein
MEEIKELKLEEVRKIIKSERERVKKEGEGEAL